MKKQKYKEIKFNCCGDSCCSDHCNSDCKKVEVSVCPRCQSVNVGYMFGIQNLFGVIPRMRCKKCNFRAMSFPLWKIDKNKLSGNAKIRRKKK
jgi:hypothetical protein